MTQSTAPKPDTPISAQVQRYQWWIFLAVLVVLWLALKYIPWDAFTFPEAWNLHLRDPIDAFRYWVIGNRNTHGMFVYFFDPLSDAIDWSIRRVENFLLWLPWPFLVLGVTLLGLKLGGWKVALIAGFSILAMGLLGLWEESMQTLALILVSVFIALAVGIPLGIWAGRNDRVDAILRPILDAMQTMPAFVYLIPVLLFFGIARVPATIATVIYALPPAIRLTNLGIRHVPYESIEAARAFGATPRQVLLRVQIPLAMPTIMAGVNQTIMMALGIVVIAALIGSGGLGREVLVGLQRLRVGQAFAAGLAIVFMAVMLDRLSHALTKVDVSQRRSQKYGRDRWDDLRDRFPPIVRRNSYLLLFILLIIITTAIHWFVTDLQTFPKGLYVPIEGPIDVSVRWMRDNLYNIGNSGIGTGPFSDFLTIYALTPLRNLFTLWLPWPVMILAVAGIATWAGGWRLGLATVVGMFAMGLLGMWFHSMDTAVQVIVAVALAVAIAVPLGILSAESNAFQAALRPLLDFIQTIPPFVYLVPVIMLFNVGRVPGIIASVLYALPPAVRLTDLGIRSVDKETIEAARAFGSTSRQILFKVKLPLAMPSIMMGVNQTVMMVLAMVIIAGLVGGGGLGLEAVIGLAKTQTGRGVEAGIAIVIMAMILDRMTQGWAKKWQVVEQH